MGLAAMKGRCPRSVGLDLALQSLGRFPGSPSRIDLPVARNAQVSPAGAWRAFQQKQTARKISPAEFVFDKLVGTSINTSYALWLENATLRGAVGDATAREPALSVGFSPVAGRWYHLAYTFDDSGKRHAPYLDGTLVASGTVTKSIGYDGQPLLLGRGRQN